MICKLFCLTPCLPNLTSLVAKKYEISRSISVKSRPRSVGRSTPSPRPTLTPRAAPVRKRKSICTFKPHRKKPKTPFKKPRKQKKAKISSSKYSKRLRRRRTKLKKASVAKTNSKNLINIKTQVKETITENISFAYDSSAAFVHPPSSQLQVNSPSNSTSKFPPTPDLENEENDGKVMNNQSGDKGIRRVKVKVLAEKQGDKRELGRKSKRKSTPRLNRD